MKKLDILNEVYESFLAIEAEEWGIGELSYIRKYSWEEWYRPSRLQFARLIAENFQEETSFIGGTERLNAKVGYVMAKHPESESLRWQVCAKPTQSEALLSAKPSFGQIVCDLESRVRVAQKIWEDFPYGASLLFLGDDDLVSLSLANDGYPSSVYDVDSRIAELVANHEHIEYSHRDIREKSTGNIKFEAVLLDPADGSVALNYWFQRAVEYLSDEEGARIYLSINPWRLGKRWQMIVQESLRHGIVPVGQLSSVKHYPTSSGGHVLTDLWVFERTALTSFLPQPYLDIEVFR